MENKSGLAAFKESMKGNEPSSHLSPHAKALWYAGKGNWDKAHEIVQDMPDRAASSIHAFLHRQEGDISNAQYWYDKAGSHMPKSGLDDEWELLVGLVLGE
jgi:hypothetical protein